MGNLHETALSLFNMASGAYLLATFAYIAYLWADRRAIGQAGTALTALGAAAHTVALILRWIEGGLMHPPFTNLYESLVFFGWGIALVYLYFERRSGSRILGAFVVPLCLVVMGLATLTHNKEIEPLVPALQSWWLHAHVIFACFGYAAFLVAFGFSILYLLGGEFSFARWGAALSGMAALSFLVYSSGSIITDGRFIVSRLLIGPEGQVTGGKIALWPAGPLFRAAFAAYCAAFLLNLYEALKGAGAEEGAEEDADEAGRRGYSFTALFVAFVLHTAGLASTAFDLFKIDAASQNNNPYILALLVLTWAAAGAFVMLGFKIDTLRARLPRRRVLDEFAYKSVRVGLPLMTLVIVTGAVWANYAWGSYWSWDAKETWSLITWFVYAIYLHARITRGWTGRRPAYINIIGFITVIFTYLGVNLLLSGLHSYGSG